MSNPASDVPRIDLDALRRAVKIYLALAYNGSEPPVVVHRRIDWPEGIDAATLFAAPPLNWRTVPNLAFLPFMRFGSGIPDTRT